MTGPDGGERRGNPPPLTSPYRWQCNDYTGLGIGVAFAFLPVVHVITTIATHRDPGCAFTKIIVGDPSGSPTVIDVPEGDSDLTAQVLTRLNALGLIAVEQVINTQVTAA